jgi:CRISPR system Cascade subunit CasD
VSGLILRLAGPLQSWGEASTFTRRDTARFPTRSGLIGLFASAQGHDRTAPLDAYAPLSFTVRVDQPGHRIVDLHTVGGGGGGELAAKVFSHRHYLADAVFVVAVTGPAPLLDQIAAALEQPRWAPYLGRRSCPPDEPFLLRAQAADPVTDLLTAVPLSVKRPPRSNTIRTEFLWDQPRGGEAAHTEIQDFPDSFTPRTRHYRRRQLWRTYEELPADLAEPPAGRTDALTGHRRLIDYALTENA